MPSKNGKIRVYSLDGKRRRSIPLPNIFNVQVRADLIKRAVVALQSHRLQPKGRNPMAGKRTSAESYGVGYGMARVPRVKGRRHPRAGAGAFAPGTVGGRLAHPPTPNKKIYKRLNEKERLQAIESAISATADKNLVSRRGHVFDEDVDFPIVVSDEIEDVKKTAAARQVLEKVGVWKDVERVKNGVKIRPGKGKMRGRRKKVPVGPLLVVNDDKGIVKAARNIIGLDVIKVRNLNAEALAPGTHPGRLTVWSKSAIENLSKIS